MGMSQYLLNYQFDLNEEDTPSLGEVLLLTTPFPEDEILANIDSERAWSLKYFDGVKLSPLKSTSIKHEFIPEVELKAKDIPLGGRIKCFICHTIDDKTYCKKSFCAHEDKEHFKKEKK